MLADAQGAHKKPSATRIRPPRDGCHVFKAGLRTFEGVQATPAFPPVAFPQPESCSGCGRTGQAGA